MASSTTLSSLVKISSFMGFIPMELKASLELLTKEMVRLFGTYSCSLLLLDADGNTDLIFSGPTEIRRRFYRFFKNPEKCLVIRDELPFIINDTRERDRRCRGFAFYRNVGSYACFPISTGKKLLGILSMSYPKTGAFTRQRLELMLSVSTLVASFLQQAQLFRKLNQEKRRLERANEEINKLNVDLNTKIEELRKAQRQIIQTEKLAVAGRLAAGIAHEINNPIGIIINRIECLQLEAQEKGFSEDLMKDLNTISLYARRISRIVEDLSIFSRTTYSDADFTLIDVNEILASEAQPFYRPWRKVFDKDIGGYNEP